MTEKNIQAPTSAVAGQIIFDTTTAQVKVYDGSTYQAIVKDLHIDINQEPRKCYE